MDHFLLGLASGGGGGGLVGAAARLLAKQEGLESAAQHGGQRQRLQAEGEQLPPVQPLPRPLVAGGAAAAAQPRLALLKMARKVGCID